MRDRARAKLATVEEEMEALRLQLQAKQAVAAQLRTEAAGHDEGVLKVRVKFARQLNRLQNKEVTMKDNQEEWELEKKAYEAHKAQHDAQVHAHSEAMLARDQLLDALHRQVDMADTFESIVAKEIGFEAGSDDGAASSNVSDNDELAQLQANVVECEAAMSESKAALQAVTTILHNLEQEVQDLECRIPLLEETKKVAAGQRDFKAAGKASREIKEATARLAECQDERQGDAATQAHAAATELAQRERDLAEARAVAQTKERASAVATMKQLANHMKRLMATKRQVCGGDAAQDPRSVPAVGALVLQAQIRALQMEGQTYGDKFGGWEELMADMECVEEEEDGTRNNNEVDSNDDSAAPEEKAPATDVLAPNEEDVQNEKKVLADAVERSNGTSLERMHQFRDVTLRLKDMETELNEAVDGEDYERAAGLEESLQNLLAEVEALNLTDEEMEAALALPPDDGNSFAEAESTAEEEQVGEVIVTAMNGNSHDDDEDDNTHESIAPVESAQSGSSVDPSQDGILPVKSNEISDDEDAVPAVADSKSFDSAADERSRDNGETTCDAASNGADSAEPTNDDE